MSVLEATLSIFLVASAALNAIQFVQHNRIKASLKDEKVKGAVDALNDILPAIVGPFEEYVDEHDDWLRRVKTGSSLTAEEQRALIDHAHKRQRPPELKRIQERGENILAYYDNVVRNQTKDKK
jgi:hypothetical protein